MKPLLVLLSILFISCSSEKPIHTIDVKFSEELQKNGYEIVDFAFMQHKIDMYYWFVSNKTIEGHKSIQTIYDKLDREIVKIKINKGNFMPMIDEYTIAYENYKNPSNIYYIRIDNLHFSLVNKIIISSE